jgi:hypothetical protein
MRTLQTSTRTVTVDAPPDVVTRDLADPATHADWALEFFAGPVTPFRDDEYVAIVPRLGGRVRLRVDADIPAGRLDMYIAPLDAAYGPPLPIRVIPNLDGCDVLFTLSRSPGLSDEQWEEGLRSMDRELQNLAVRFTRT